MSAVSQCPNCRALNSYKTQHCIDCRQSLPWGDTVAALQNQIEQANSLVQATQQQAQQAVVQAHHAALARSRSGVDHIDAPNITPNDKLNPFEVYMGAFLGRWGTAFRYLDRSSAPFVGLGALVVSILAAWIGIQALADQALAALPPFLRGATFPSASPGGLGTVETPSIPLSHIFRLSLIVGAPFIAVFLACAITRLTSGSQDDECGMSGDVLVAGMTVLPWGLALFAVGIAGLAQWEFAFVTLTFAACYSFLALYHGCTTIIRLRDSVAAFCVPTTLLLAAWITKLIITRVMQSMITNSM